MCHKILHLKTIYLSAFQKNIIMPPLKLLNYIYANNLQTIFRNICISYRIFCTIPVTVVETERSFNKLRNSQKTRQKSTPSQERLNLFARVYMENALASTINFNDIINEFAMLKAHKQILNFNISIYVFQKIK